MKTFPLMFSALITIASSASADQWWSALGWSCNEERQNLMMYPVRYDANTEQPRTGVGLFVPQEHFGLEKGTEILVFECQFNTVRSITVSLTEINTPRPRGMCGGNAWSTYVVRENGQEKARFPQGCMDSFVQIDQNYLKICPLSEACKIQRGDSVLHLNSIGRWIGD